MKFRADPGGQQYLSHDHQTSGSEAEIPSPLTYYLDSSLSPDPLKLSFPEPSEPPSPDVRVFVNDIFGVANEDIVICPPEDDEIVSPPHLPPKPTIIITSLASPGPPLSLTATSADATPRTFFQRYPGWLSPSADEPLEQFIDEAAVITLTCTTLRRATAGSSLPLG